MIVYTTNIFHPSSLLALHSSSFHNTPSLPTQQPFPFSQCFLLFIYIIIAIRIVDEKHFHKAQALSGPKIIIPAQDPLEGRRGIGAVLPSPRPLLLGVIAHRSPKCRLPHPAHPIHSRTLKYAPTNPAKEKLYPILVYYTANLEDTSILDILTSISTSS